MNKLITRAGVAALVAPFALAAGVMPVAAAQNGNSAADIEVENCVVESTKDISYIEYFLNGESMSKDESIGTEIYKLAAATEPEFDAVRVKSGGTTTTIKPVEDRCDGSTDDNTGNSGESQGSVDNDDDENDRGNNGNNGQNNGDASGDDEGNGQEEADGQAGGSDGKTDNPGKSETTITLEGCIVDSGKDISYIAFFLDGELVLKDEDIDGDDFNLSTIGFDFDEIEVKSGTTVEVIPVNDDCETPETGDTTDEGGDDNGGMTGGNGDTGNTQDDDDRPSGDKDNDGNDRGDDNRGNDRDENRGGNDRGDRDNDRGDDNRADRDNERGNGEVRGEQAMNAGDNAAPAPDAEVLGVEDTVAVPTEVAAGVSGTEALPQTGVEDKLVLFGAIGLGLLALGGAAMVIRRRLGSGL